MANSVVINYLVKVAGVKDVDTLKAKLTNLTTAKGFQSAVMGVGMGVGLAAWNQLGNAIQGAAAFMGDSIAVASGLSESMSKAKVVFGAAAEEVDKFAETSAESFGISKRAAYEATGTFGNLFATMGFAQDAAADMSVDITKLAADLASFHNIDIEAAFDKLRAGLVGETEPMRQLGVMLNAAAVEAKVLKMGLAATKGQITESMKVTARYALIMEQTGAAQGDFARTSDGLANSQRSLNAQLEDAQAALGEELLPAMIELTKFAKDYLVPAVDIATGAIRLFGYAVGGLTVPFKEVTYNGEIVVTTVENITRAQDLGVAAWNTYAQSVMDATPGLVDNRKETLNAARASEAWTARLDGLASLVEDTGDASGDAAPYVIDLADAFKEAAKWSDTFRESYIDTLGALIDDTNSPKVLTLELESLTAELSNSQRELRELEAIKNPTAAQRQDIADTKLEIIDTKKQIVLTETRLESLNGVSLTDIQLMLKNLGKYGIDPLSADARELLGILLRIGSVAPTGTQGSAWRLGITPKAAGGPVYPGQSYIVGEEGPELFAPTTPGTIVPSGAFAPAASAAPVNVAVYLDSEQIAARVERRQYFAASVAPVSAR